MGMPVSYSLDAVFPALAGSLSPLPLTSLPLSPLPLTSLPHSPLQPVPLPLSPLQPVPLQTTTVSVLTTYVLFAAFLSFTAFIAARNLLGDVSLRRHALVGPPLAAIAFVAATFEFSPFLALGAALAVDAAAFRYLHGLDRKLLAGVVLIHFVVSVLLGTVLFGVVTLLSTAPV